MSFEEFLSMCDVADFVWEIFKGVSPTVIALVTIWINTKISKKKAKDDSVSEQIKELQLMVSELILVIVGTGEHLLEAIQCSDDEKKSNEEFDQFYSKNKQMLTEARKFLTYANIRAEALGMKSIAFTDAYSSITEYSYELIEILNWYNQKASVTPRKEFDGLCDEVQKKMIDATRKIEGILFEYCVNLSK